ncbi:MAG: GNAT family N-acetyltransferase [Rhodothalassiaceae bacterium]
MTVQQRAKIEVRPMRVSDVPAVHRLLKKVYRGDTMLTLSPEHLRGPLTRFPEGQFVALWEGEIAGFCGTFRISERAALSPHTYAEITGNGYAARHDPKGEWLYGMEVAVDPDTRGRRLGQRLYQARKELCQRLKLKGIVFGGRMPGFSRRRKTYPTPEAYLEAVENRQVRDMVVSFQLNEDFEPIGVLRKYLPLDKDSGGHAVHMVWRNPDVPAEEGVIQSTVRREHEPHRPVRVAAIQLKMRPVKDFDDFIGNVDYFVEIAADYYADFAVLPELFTLQLLSAQPKKLDPAAAIEALTDYTDRFREAMSDMAVRYNINIIGGSHPTHVGEDEVRNVAYVFLRDGSIHAQEKIHPTPNEEYWWNISGGSKVSVIDTDCGPIGVLICYDCEFPELARRLIDQGAQILFVPFCTDERQSYLRVRYCAQARAVENQCFVVMSGNVGNLPNVENMDIQYAQSCVLTPCDFPFARDGIAADTTPNVETLAFADLNLDLLTRARNDGTVQNLKNRRFDLYHVTWTGEVKADAAE